MSLRFFISRDAGALAVGANDVANVLLMAARARHIEIELVRTGSRGMYWLEPLVEVQTPAGRVAYGPVTKDSVSGILDAALGSGAHRLYLGPTEDIPWLKRQTRLTFARCGIVDPLSFDDYRAHGGGKGIARAVALGADAVIDALLESGLRGRGGAGFPAGIKWRAVAQTPALQKYIVCNADEGDSGTFADRMIMEGDLPAHKNDRVRSIIEAAGAELRYLPPYSPDLNPIEMAFAKLKAHLRKTAERSIPTLWDRIGSVLNLFSPSECANFFNHAGYA